ncbi:MAG TPA: phospholipase D-like domain-containing protein [Planctomycetota bacterium]|nr:phospholipase D-like domain-containing protein [Planctomycetota bacterium]
MENRRKARDVLTQTLGQVRVPRIFRRRRGPATTLPEGSDLAALKYVHRKERLRADNHIDPLCCGGEAFPAMLEAIAGATRYVHLETYIYRNDDTGRRFQAAMIERAKAGVRVRLLYDALGSFELPESFVAELRAGGVHVGEFHPIAPWRDRYGFNQRDHMKILVVDGRVGFTGGINIGDEYMSLEQGGGGWYDMHARVQGSIVSDLDQLFASTWARATGESVELAPRSHEKAPLPHMLATVIDNFGIRNRSRKRIAYLHAIRAAKKRISIMNAYFIPDRGMRRALRRAVSRGVLVELIVPGVSDVEVVLLASRYLYPRLLRGGIHIYEWPERMMHAKTAVVDGLWSTIGSYNIDRRSLFHNLEASVVIADAPFGERMQGLFDQELSKSREVTRRECAERPLFVKLKQWFCYLWRYWL